MRMSVNRGCDGTLGIAPDLNIEFAVGDQIRSSNEEEESDNDSIRLEC